jgi:hypothetical protein
VTTWSVTEPGAPLSARVLPVAYNRHICLNKMREIVEQINEHLISLLAR